MRTVSVLAALAVSLLAACSSPTPGPQAAAALPNGAPLVPVPLNTSRLDPRPCDVLTAEQGRQLLGSRVEARPGANPAACTLARPDYSADVSIVLYHKGNNGLDVIYGWRERAGYFIELPPVQGYPAVAAATRDTRPDGECAVWVGTTDTSSIQVRINQSQEKIGKADPCQLAHKTATLVVGNIRARR